VGSGASATPNFAVPRELHDRRHTTGHDLLRATRGATYEMDDAVLSVGAGSPAGPYSLTGTEGFIRDPYLGRCVRIRLLSRRGVLRDAGEHSPTIRRELDKVSTEAPVARRRRQLGEVHSPSIALRIPQRAVPEAGPDVSASMSSSARRPGLSRVAWTRGHAGAGDRSPRHLKGGRRHARRRGFDSRGARALPSGHPGSPLRSADRSSISGDSRRRAGVRGAASPSKSPRASINNGKFTRVPALPAPPVLQGGRRHAAR
jgi:hypothetical protein